MKNISTKTKIITLIIAIIIIVGLIITFTIGLNFDLRYQQSEEVQLLIGKEYQISDIRQITNEIFPGQQVTIQKAREFEDVVNITVKQITDDQKTNLINKINEKYETEIKSDNIEIDKIPHTRGRDIIKPYVIPFIISTMIILVYMMIRYYKLGILKILLKYICTIIITQIFLLSIMAITRIPIGRLTVPLILLTYVLTLIFLTNYFEKKLSKKKSEEKNK